MNLRTCGRRAPRAWRNLLPPRAPPGSRAAEAAPPGNRCVLLHLLS